MKKLAAISLSVVLLAGMAWGAVDLQNVTKYTVSAATPLKRADRVSGTMLLKSNAASCSVFLNATTLARTVAGTGFPLTANTETVINVPKTSNLSFTCATSAGNRAVYILR